jgi:spore coat polysaccharide biosynthesis protein SpsF
MSAGVGTVAILQARCSSSRLPGKVLKPILGTPMLAHQLARLGAVTHIDKLVVATSTDATDDPLVELCERAGVSCFRGDLNDVLDRYYQAARAEAPDHVVRLTGDCPLTDPEVIDQLMDFYHEGGYDYASNTIKPTFPHGLDCEVFSFAALEEAWREARLPSQREHVTPFIKTQPERYRLGLFQHEPDLSHLRWTVDEPSDFAFVTRVYERLYSAMPNFRTRDVLRLLEREPELASINASVIRDEGYKKSLQQDAEYQSRHKHV